MPQTAVGHAFDYMIGLAAFGATYWLLNGILPDLGVVSVQDDVYTLAWYLWHATLVIYLIFGVFWFFNALKEWQFVQRGNFR